MKADLFFKNIHLPEFCAFIKPLALSRISFNSETMTFKSALPPDPSDLNLAPLLKTEMKE